MWVSNRIKKIIIGLSDLKNPWYDVSHAHISVKSMLGVVAPADATRGRKSAENGYVGHFAVLRPTISVILRYFPT